MIENDIRNLLESPTAGDGTPSLGAIEEVLTSGYARAMAIEAERRRVQRLLTDVAIRLADDAGAQEGPEELKTLAARLRSLDAELTALRALLVALRGRAAEARADAA
jgi:hypothetical protein